VLVASGASRASRKFESSNAWPSIARSQPLSASRRKRQPTSCSVISNCGPCPRPRSGHAHLRKAAIKLIGKT
jgi:hypothetical protein